MGTGKAPERALLKHQCLVCAPEDFFFSFFGETERSTSLMSNEGDSEQVVELHSTEPTGVHILLFCDREN